MGEWALWHGACKGQSRGSRVLDLGSLWRLLWLPPPPPTLPLSSSPLLPFSFHFSFSKFFLISIFFPSLPPSILPRIFIFYLLSLPIFSLFPLPLSFCYLSYLSLFLSFALHSPPSPPLAKGVVTEGPKEWSSHWTLSNRVRVREWEQDSSRWRWYY